MIKDSKKSEQTETEPKKARRELLGSGAMAAASMMFGLVAAACSDDSDSPAPASRLDGGVDGGTRDGSIAPSIDSGVIAADAAAGTGTDKDIVQLNALLSAEYTAITAYGAGASVIAGAAANDPLKSLATPITEIAVSIQAQHKLHAAALVDAINALNGVPVKESEVAAKFAPPAALLANPTITNVLKFAAGAERAAAVSYNTVVGNLEAAKYRFLATTIEGDESQHFIVLTALVLGLAAPGPNLAAHTSQVFPEPFVHSFGSSPGLDTGPINYFS
ncbi:MAG: hypothetical protein JWN48_3934 [Myxococcaceae bacterium]|nr:hypothetical protein [Myxococcaceae bacterium]